jgi:uncharacterized membrane protein
MTLEQLSDSLSRPLTIDAVPPDNSAPWYVQLMLGICAWFAGLLLLSFILVAVVGAARGGDQWAVTIVLGVIGCGGSALIYRAISETSAFGSQFALAMSIAGQLGITIGLAGSGGPQPTLWGMLVVELAMIAAVQNRLHRVLVTMFAVVAWALAMTFLLNGDLPGIELWSRRSETVYSVAPTAVVSWFAIWAPVAFAAFWLVKNEARWMSAGYEAWLRPITAGLLAAIAIVPLATHPATFWLAIGFGSRSHFANGAGATALWPLLAMLLAILSLALSFTIRNRALMGVAILFALLEIGSFYYVLGTTLLVKSIIMIVLGCTLLGAAQYLAKERAA